MPSLEFPGWAQVNGFRVTKSERNEDRVIRYLAFETEPLLIEDYLSDGVQRQQREEQRRIRSDRGSSEK
jgi:hypothetical protein